MLEEEEKMHHYQTLSLARALETGYKKIQEIRDLIETKRQGTVPIDTFKALKGGSQPKTEKVPTVIPLSPTPYGSIPATPSGSKVKRTQNTSMIPQESNAVISLTPPKDGQPKKKRQKTEV